MPEHEPFRDFIQIAGIHDLEEARLVIGCGVRFLGFPLRLPVHAEDLSEAEASGIIRAIEPAALGVVITYLRDAEEIAGLLELLGARIVQLHGDVPVGELERLRRLRPDLRIIKSLIVGEGEPAVLLATVDRLSPLVDAFLTDSLDPATGARGATGRVHDWRVSRALVEASPRPVILAGGLTPENVSEAIRAVRPAGVDSHTGVEDAAGRKDAAKVRRFVTRALDGLRRLRRGGTAA